MHGLCDVERGSAGIASDPDGNLRSEVFDDAAGEPTTFEDFEKHGHVLQQVLAVESRNGKSLDFVTCSRNALHFHASFRTDEKDFCIGAFGFDFVGYGNGGKDVTTGSAAADDDS